MLINIITDVHVDVAVCNERSQDLNWRQVEPKCFEAQKILKIDFTVFFFAAHPVEDLSAGFQRQTAGGNTHWHLVSLSHLPESQACPRKDG
jgi:hypothetical protein